MHFAERSSSLSACLSLFLVLLASTLASDAQAQTTSETTVTARRYEFVPRTIKVQTGQRVRLIVTAEDVDHGLAIEGYDIEQVIPAGETRTIEFIASRQGVFRMQCSLFCGEGHPEMEGELVVDSRASSGVAVEFDESEPGVVIVEASGEKLRIDTRNRSVVRVSEASGDSEPSAAVPTQDDRAARRAEPYDYRLINLPTTRRVPRGSLNLGFTHRFTQSVRPLDESADDLFGFDSFSIASFGVSYGLTSRLYASAYRSPICQPGLCKTIELGLGYHLLDEDDESPLSLSTYASVEGDGNFKRGFTYTIQGRLGRSITEYVHLFFSPAVHFNTNGNGRFNPRPEDFFPPEPQAERVELGRHTGSYGFGVHARVRPTMAVMFEYVPRTGFKLGRLRPTLSADLGRIIGFENESEASFGFGIEKRIGGHFFALTFSNNQATTTSRYNSSNVVLPPGKFTIGFNLSRRLL